MKKCIHCGCINKETRGMCADCGKNLANALSVGEDEIDGILEKASRFSDLFSFKPRYQVVFYASLALIAADIALVLFSMILPEWALVSVIFSVVLIAATRFSETLWKIKKFFLGFTVYGEIEPSDWWFISREIAIFGLFGLNIIAFIIGITNIGA